MKEWGPVIGPGLDLSQLEMDYAIYIYIYVCVCHVWVNKNQDKDESQEPCRSESNGSLQEYMRKQGELPDVKSAGRLLPLSS